MARPVAVPLSGLALAGLMVSGMALAPAQAQTPAEDRVTPEAVRAINLARTYTVRLNGGLQRYRPAQCMFATAAPSNPCLLREGEDGFLFRFLGGPPGWEEREQQPTWESQLLVSPDGRQLERMVYNGPPR